MSSECKWWMGEQSTTGAQGGMAVSHSRISPIGFRIYLDSTATLHADPSHAVPHPHPVPTPFKLHPTLCITPNYKTSLPFHSFIKTPFSQGPDPTEPSRRIENRCAAGFLPLGCATMKGHSHFAVRTMEAAMASPSGMPPDGEIWGTVAGSSYEWGAWQSGCLWGRLALQVRPTFWPQL